MNATAAARRTAVMGAILLMSTLVTGCAYRTPRVTVPASLPRLGEVSVTVDEGAHGFGEDVAVRRHVTEILAKATKAHRGADGPARVDVRVVVHPHPEFQGERFYLPMLIWALPFGLVTTHERLTVDVTVETSERVLRGRGDADVWGSLYAPPLRRAVAVALDRAFDAAAP